MRRIAILGPSGSGKTTLLNLIGGLDHPDTGYGRFQGAGYYRIFQRWRWITSGTESIGFVFQFHHLLPQCTLLENVLIPTLVNRDKDVKTEKAERAEALMKRVGIWEYRDKLPGKLSGGECQRAAVVRAMINNPFLLLADEPTGALDRDNVENMADLLLELNREDGLTLLVVTHSSDLAKRMGRTLELQNGKLDQSLIRRAKDSDHERFQVHTETTLLYYWRKNLLLALGVAISGAVLTGALMVGDSVKYSLNRIVEHRLGKVTHVLKAGDRYFTSGSGRTGRRCSCRSRFLPCFCRKGVPWPMGDSCG